MDTEVERHGAYRVDEGVLGDVCTSMQKFLDVPPIIQVDFRESDGEKDSGEFTSVAGMKESSLVRNRVIDRIVIRGSNYKPTPPRSAAVYVGTASWPLAIRFQASGDPDRCAIIKAEMKDHLFSKRLWYSFLYPGSFRSCL
jgi:hypothetical protein